MAKIKIDIDKIFPPVPKKEKKPIKDKAIAKKPTKLLTSKQLLMEAKTADLWAYLGNIKKADAIIAKIPEKQKAKFMNLLASEVTNTLIEIYSKQAKS